MATRTPNAGQESEQDGAGQEIGEESEPGQPGQEQQSAREQGGEAGQTDVPRRPGNRQPSEGRGEYGGGRRVGGDDEMA